MIRNCCWLLACVVCVVCVGLPLSAAVAEEAPARRWHDRSGFFTLDAEIAGIDREQKEPRLKLRKSDGTVVLVPYSMFCEADQKFAVDWYKTQQAKPAKTIKRKLPVVGDRVKNHWGSTWYSGKIVEVDADRYKFRYDGYSASWDEWKTADKLRWEDDSPVVPTDASPADVASHSTGNRNKSPKSANASRNADDSMQKPPPPAEQPIASQISKTTVPPRTKLPIVGDRVKMEWGGKWWPGVIMEVDGDRYRFNYDGWDSSPDEWRTAEQLRWEDDNAVVPGGPAEQKPEPPSTGPKPAPTIAVTAGSGAPLPTEATKPAMDLSRFESSTETTSPFPPGLTPEQTLAYLRKETMSGNLSVLWDWIPDELQSYATSQEQRDNLAVLDQVKPEGLRADHFLAELVTVLRTQKAFVLNNPVVALLLEDEANIAALAEVYDPATALLDEFTQLLGNIDSELRGDEFETAFRGRCDRIGRHLATLVKAAPPAQVQAFWDRIAVTQTDGGGTLTMTYPDGSNRVYELVRINDRWLPRLLAESLLSFPDAQREKAREISALSKAQIDGRYQGASMAQGFKDANYMSLAEKLRTASQAKTQAEFDASVQQVLVALQVGGWLGG